MQFAISKSIRTLLIWVLLFVASVRDTKIREVPNVFIYAIGAIQFLYILLSSGSQAVFFHLFMRSCIAGIEILAFFLGICFVIDALGIKQGIGGGDIKLLSVLGTVLGFKGALLNLLLGCVAALVFCFARRKKLSDTFPFVPFIAIGNVAVATCDFLGVIQLS